MRGKKWVERLGSGEVPYEAKEDKVSIADC